jgi:hypothetical protein
LQSRPPQRAGVCDLQDESAFQSPSGLSRDAFRVITAAVDPYGFAAAFSCFVGELNLENRKGNLTPHPSLFPAFLLSR